jgi:uncharacterized low-complexity protein
MLVSTRLLTALGLAVALSLGACATSDEATSDQTTAADQEDEDTGQPDPTTLEEGDCEEGKKNPIPAARKLMDAQVPSIERAFFEGTAEVCGIEEFGIEVASVPKGGGTPRAYFSPTVLIGEPGQELTLHVVWGGGRTHNFSLDEQGIDEIVMPDEPATVQVKFPENGKPLLFYCSFHDIGGQWGALVTY